MNHRTRMAACAALAGLGLLGLVGCTAKGPQMKVGVVNTARIVEQNPKYLDLNMIWVEEKNAVYSQIPSDIGRRSDAEKRDLQAKLTKEAGERSAKFDKLVRDFMKQMQTDIQDSAATVAREKGIDMIIIDTPYFPTVLYCGGENVTTDILLKMKTK